MLPDQPESILNSYSLSFHSTSLSAQDPTQDTTPQSGSRVLRLLVVATASQTFLPADDPVGFEESLRRCLVGCHPLGFAPNFLVIRLRFGEEDHGDNMPSPAHDFKSAYRQACRCAVDLHHLADVVFVSFHLHSFSPSPFPYHALGKEVTMNGPHLSGKLCSASLWAESLRKLFGIRLRERFVYIRMDLWVYMFILWTIIQCCFTSFFLLR